MKDPSNPWKHTKQKKLTQALGVDTLEGGTEGRVKETRRAEFFPNIPVSSAEGLVRLKAMLVTLLDAVSDIVQALTDCDRDRLDAAVDSMIECIEEARDAVPKA